MAVWQTQEIGQHVVKTESRDPRRSPTHPFVYVDVSSVSNTLFAITAPSDMLGQQAPSRARKVIRTGDVIFATVRPTLRRVALVTDRFDNQICSTGYCVLRPRPTLDSSFLYFWLLTDHVLREVAKVERGANYPAIRDSDLKCIHVPLPEVIEQRKIAAVLSGVQRAIEQQERLIALTRELKKALMHKLFTEGARGEPQKQTEIGPVPESWRLRRLGDVFDAQLGKMLSKKARAGQNPLPYLRNANVQWGYIDTSDLLQMDFSELERLKFELKPGDLLVCEGGQPGRAAIWDGLTKDCYYQKALHRLRPKDNSATNIFLLFWLWYSISVQNVYGVSGASSTIAHLPAAQLKSLMIPMPSRDEQDAITTALKAVAATHAVHETRKARYDDLFRTLLHQLMTAQIRVNDLDLSELEAVGAGDLQEVA